MESISAQRAQTRPIVAVFASSSQAGAHMLVISQNILRIAAPPLSIVQAESGRLKL
jgi:hypothetical protein